MTAILSKSSDRASNHILLQSIRWQQYRAIADDLESQHSKRLTYDNGILEIRMPSGKRALCFEQSQSCFSFTKNKRSPEFPRTQKYAQKNALIRQVREWAAKLVSS